MAFRFGETSFCLRVSSGLIFEMFLSAQRTSAAGMQWKEWWYALTERKSRIVSEK